MKNVFLVAVLLFQSLAFAQRAGVEEIYQQGKFAIDGLLILARDASALRAENEFLKSEIYNCRNPQIQNEIYADRNDKNMSVQYFFDTGCTQPMPKMWMSHDKRKNESLCETLVNFVDRTVKVRGLIKNKGPGSGQCLSKTTNPVGVYEECVSVGTQTIF